MRDDEGVAHLIFEIVFKYKIFVVIVEDERQFESNHNGGNELILMWYLFFDWVTFNSYEVVVKFFYYYLIIMVKDLGVRWWGQMDFIPSTRDQSSIETPSSLDVRLMVWPFWRNTNLSTLTQLTVLIFKKETIFLNK